MGDFDTVTTTDPRFVCASGHPIGQMQTQDFAGRLGFIEVSDRITSSSGGDGDPLGDVARPLTVTFNAYANCYACPCFLQLATMNVVHAWVEFQVTVVDDEVAHVTRISETTEEYLYNEPTRSEQASCIGPMSYAAATKLQDKARGNT